jgi:hypothetical protein
MYCRNVSTRRTGTSISQVHSRNLPEKDYERRHEILSVVIQCTPSPSVSLRARSTTSKSRKVSRSRCSPLWPKRQECGYLEVSQSVKVLVVIRWTLLTCDRIYSGERYGW